jgi:hypothetical protein
MEPSMPIEIISSYLNRFVNPSYAVRKNMDFEKRPDHDQKNNSDIWKHKEIIKANRGKTWMK